MFKNLHILDYFKYALVAALLFAVPMYFFLKDATYQQTWLLYLGNALVLLFMFLFVILYNKSKNEDANTNSTTVATLLCTILSVIITLVLAIILVFMMIPGLFHSEADKTLASTPANMIHGKTNGMLYILFLSIVIGNFAAGSFVAIITSYTAKRNQTRQSLPPDKLDLETQK